MAILCKPRQIRKEATVVKDSSIKIRLAKGLLYSSHFEPKSPYQPHLMYQVLARKWRPKNFAEVIGQEHAVRALTNALAQKRLHHAYLFTGTRGVGKTTIARILAKCFNCQTGITNAPCGQCDACVEIDSGRFIDLTEVDAASRTKVEDTRDLLDNAQYLPVSGRYKIYLIDEVHMLSGHSFNALLKTLEEPPEHVKFLLATTDPQKLPITVLSRCLQFNLKKLPHHYIQQQLCKILNAENIIYDDVALNNLALAADGSVRDALSLLDQAIAYGGGAVKKEDVSAMLGTIDQTYILQLLENLAKKDANAILQIIAHLASLAKDFNDVLNELLQNLHQIAMLQILSSPSSNYCHATAVDVSSNFAIENQQELSHLAQIFSAEDIQLYYQIGLIGKRDLPLAPTPQSGFEMVMLRMLAFCPRSLAKNLEASDAPDIAPSNKQKYVEHAKYNENTENVVSCNSHNIRDIHDIIATLQMTGPTAALLQHCVLAHIDDNNVSLFLNSSHAPLLNKNHEERLQKAFSEVLSRQMRVTINIGETNGQTPAALAKAQQQQNLDAGLKTLAQNANVQKIINTFNATIVKDSVTIDEL